MKIMRNAHVFLLAGIIFTIQACSTESLKRTGYETLQNIQQQQCQGDLSSECPKRDSYDTYQRKLKDLENSQK